MSREYIGKKHTYRMTNENYLEFKNWCSRRGLDASLAIRGAVSLLMEKSNLTELLKNSKYRALAISVLSKNENGEGR